MESVVCRRFVMLWRSGMDEYSAIRIAMYGLFCDRSQLVRHNFSIHQESVWAGLMVGMCVQAEVEKTLLFTHPIQVSRGLAGEDWLHTVQQTTHTNAKGQGSWCHRLRSPELAHISHQAISLFRMKHDINCTITSFIITIDKSLSALQCSVTQPKHRTNLVKQQVTIAICTHVACWHCMSCVYSVEPLYKGHSE